MAQLFDIKKVVVGPRNLEAVVEVAPSAPLMTSDDTEGTELVLDLMPALADHLCLGDSSPRFGDVVADTELAHLLEHVSVELLARTDAAGDTPSGQTTQVGERTYQITLACPDDVLVAGALSSAVWILQWAYSGGGEPQPDVDAIADGLVGLVESLDPAAAGEGPVEEPTDVAEGEPEAPVQQPAAETPAADAAPAPADQPVSPDPAPARGSAPRDGWDMDDVPRPRFVR